MQVELDPFEAARTGDLQALKAALGESKGRIDANGRGETILMCSAKNGHNHCVEEILRNSGYERQIDRLGRTALMYAAINGHESCVRLLFPEEKHKQDTDGITALMHAIIRRHDHLVDLLIDEASYRAQGSVTTLMIAAEYDNISLVKRLIDTQGRLYDSNGWTALMYAIQSGAHNAVELLYEEEWDMKSNDNMSALMIAAMMGRVEAIHLLLSKPCQDWKDDRGMTALMYAAENGYTDCVEQLKSTYLNVDNLNRTALVHAAAKGHTDCVSILIKTPDVFDSNGRNALMHAADNNSLEAIRVLINGQIDKDFQKYDAAMILAAKHGYSECVEALFQARPKRRDYSTFCDWSAIMAAAVYGYEACLNTLAKGDEEVYLVLKGKGLETVKLTVLDVAACMGFTTCVECLLANRKVYCESLDTSFNPLKHAANRGYTDIVRLLINNNDFKECYGTALVTKAKIVSEAAKNGRPECLQLMMNEYSNAPYFDALYYSCQGGYIKCARLIMSKSSITSLNRCLTYRERMKNITPLMAAARSGFYDCAKLVVDKYAREKDSNNNPAIKYAILSVAINCVELLAGYERVIPCFDEETRYLPIELAKKYDLLDCVELL